MRGLASARPGAGPREPECTNQMLTSQLVQALPVLLLIVVGVLVRAGGLVDRASRLTLTRLVYYVTIPAAIFSSISRSELSLALLALPVIGFLLPCALAGVMYAATRHIADQPARRGVLLVAMVVLAVFAYPFFEVYYGLDGLAHMAMFDVGNALFAGTVALWLAAHFGQNGDRRQSIGWRKMLTSPLLVAAVAGIGVSLSDVTLRGPLWEALELLRAANTPLAMIAVGSFLEPQAAHLGLIARYVGVRMVLGGVAGLGLALLLGLDGLGVVTACVGSAMPAGTTALVYAGTEGLDTEFAASLISGTLLVGVVVIALLPLLLAGVYM